LSGNGPQTLVATIATSFTRSIFKQSLINIRWLVLWQQEWYKKLGTCTKTLLHMETVIANLFFCSMVVYGTWFTRSQQKSCTVYTDKCV
jgi:hypothetical protein